MGKSSGTSPRCSFRSPRITASCWRTRARVRTSIYPAFGRPFPLARPYRMRSTNASGIDSAWRSSTGSAAPRFCISLSPTGRVELVRAPPDGTVGNLMIKGDSTCAYYWNKHERTKDTIEGHWIRTGDKFSRDVDGYYWYAGRADDMLKVGGIWVSPVEIENTLVEHPAVQEAGVIGRRDADDLEKPMAYVVLAAGQQPSAELARELQDFVRSKIAEYKRPRWIEFVETLPKTATGKTQRFKLRQAASEAV